MTEQDDLHLRTSERHGCNICTGFPGLLNSACSKGNHEVVFGALRALFH